MATFYFNGAVDVAWNTLGNWWMNAGHTVPATALPTSTDDVVAVGGITLPSPVVTVRNITFDNCYYITREWSTDTYVGIIVTGLAVFKNGSFFDSSWTLQGDAEFNDTSSHDSTVDGNAVYNDYSLNGTQTNGNAVFNDESYNGWGAYVLGNAVFNDNARNYVFTGDFSSVGGGIVIGSSSYSLAYAETLCDLLPQRTHGFGITHGTVVIAHKGINGSSILGVV